MFKLRDTFNDDSELIEHAVVKLCEREFDKGLDNDIVPVPIQIEIFSDLAEESFKTDRFTKQFLEDCTGIYFDMYDLSVRADQIACILRHALLTHQMGDDIDFMQDIMKQYFLGLALFKYLKMNRLGIFDNRKIETDSLTTKYLIKNLMTLTGIK